MLTLRDFTLINHYYFIFFSLLLLELNKRLSRLFASIVHLKLINTVESTGPSKFGNILSNDLEINYVTSVLFFIISYDFIYVLGLSARMTVHVSDVTLIFFLLLLLLFECKS